MSFILFAQLFLVEFSYANHTEAISLFNSYQFLNPKYVHALSPVLVENLARTGAIESLYELKQFPTRYSVLQKDWGKRHSYAFRGSSRLPHLYRNGPGLSYTHRAYDIGFKEMKLGLNQVRYRCQICSPTASFHLECK